MTQILPVHRVEAAVEVGQRVDEHEPTDPEYYTATKRQSSGLALAHPASPAIRTVFFLTLSSSLNPTRPRADGLALPAACSLKLCIQEI